MEDWIKQLIQEFEKEADYKVIRMITEEGPEAVDEYGWSVIHFAVNQNMITALALLLEHKVNYDIPDGCYHLTPLHMAVEAESSTVVGMLLKAGADPNPVDINDQTPLHLAVEHADLYIINQLIEVGANKEALNGDGKTPLNLFREYNQKVEALLS